MAISPRKPYCHTNKRQMYGSQSTQASLPYICVFFPGFQLWNLAVTNSYTLISVMGVISLVDEIQFMLISSHHFCINQTLFRAAKLSHEPGFFALRLLHTCQSLEPGCCYQYWWDVHIRRLFVALKIKRLLRVTIIYDKSCTRRI